MQKLLKKLVGWPAILVAAFFFALFTSSVLAAQQGNLVAYWKFDGSVGTTTADVSGNDYNGTIDGSFAFSANVPTTSFPDVESLVFNGTDTQIDTSLSLNTFSKFTIGGWIDPTTSGDRIGFFGQNDVVEFGFADSSHVACYTANGGTVSWEFSSSTFPFNDWHHVACTGDGSVQTLYVDGQAVASTSTVVSNYGSSSDKFSIGGSVWDQLGNHFSGSIDDVRVYRRALSQTEISELANGDNTTATWTGASDYNYANGSNWNINAAPDAYTNIVVPKDASAVRWPSLMSDTGLANLDNKGLFYLGDYDLTFNDNGTFSNTGTFQLNGGQTLTNFTNDTNSGEVKYSGPSAYTGLPTGDSYYDLTFDKGTGVGTWSLESDTTLDVAHNFSLKNSVTFNAANSTMNVGGNWSNAGTFNAGSSTVNLDGNNQTISGDNTFYNLSKDQSGSNTLYFQTGKTQTIKNNLDLSGSAAHNLLALLSSSLGSAWNMDASSTKADLHHLYVQDSRSTGDTLTAKNTCDGDRDTGWIFMPEVTDFQTTAHGTSTAIFTWTQPVCVTTVTAEYSTNGGATWNPVTNIDSTISLDTDSTSTTITGLTPDTSYSFRLHLVQAAISAYSNTVNVKMDKTASPVTTNESVAGSAFIGTLTTANTASMSTSDLYSQIATLLGKVATLQKELAAQGGSNSLDFTRDLYLGTSGNDVHALQVYLNTHGFVLTQSGPGSLGNETNYFGILTKNALAKFQLANNISPSVGYFGPVTRSFIETNKSA